MLGSPLGRSLTLGIIPQIFVAVAVIYFGYIRRGMKKIAGMDAKIQERNTLHRAWLFSALTSVMVTITGVLYAGTSFYLTAFTVQSLNSKFALEFETLSSL